MNRRLATLAPISCLAATVFAAGCAAAGTHTTSASVAPAAPAGARAPVSPSAQLVLPSSPAAVDASSAPPPTAPTHSAPPPPSASPPPSATPATNLNAPHFDTPDAAMRYLVAAYNANNETNIKHVTTPDSRDQFETERQWVKAFRFNNCAPEGAPSWNYTCVLDIIATMPGVAVGDQVMNEVTVLVAPAARPGYYLLANYGCGD